jgi:hypothetical protein
MSALLFLVPKTYLSPNMSILLSTLHYKYLAFSLTLNYDLIQSRSLVLYFCDLEVMQRSSLRWILGMFVDSELKS